MPRVERPISQRRDRSARPEVVVIGCGFGGLRVAKGLRNLPVNVTVVDRNNFHVFQPLLYQVATAGLGADDISFPLRGILRRYRNCRFRMGSVTAIDLEAMTIIVNDDQVLDFDFLVVAAGAVSSSFGIAGVDEHTFALKTLHDAVGLRAHLLSGFEHASSRSTPDSGATDLGIVVVGGGPTGVEVAGGLRELVDRVLDKDYPDLDLRRVPITLVEATDRVLGQFHPSLSTSAAQTLRRRGVEVITGVGVDHIEQGSVTLQDGRVLRAGTVVWAAGVAGSPIAQMLGIELARGSRIPVNHDLSLAGHLHVFAIGDIAFSPTEDHRGLPQVAQPAIQGGTHVARQIARLLRGEPTEAFHYVDKGSMATIGRSQAVVELPNGRRFKGIIGWALWLGLHIVYLMGFRNRINVFINWSWNYLTYDRGSRMIVEDAAASEPRIG